MKTTFRTALAAAFFVVFYPNFASAQDQCGPVNGMEQHFLEAFGERVVTELVNADGSILVLMVNDETQGWTLVVHDGITGCIVAAGQGINSLLPVGMAL